MGVIIEIPVSTGVSRQSHVRDRTVALHLTCIRSESCPAEGLSGGFYVSINYREKNSIFHEDAAIVMKLA